MEVVEENRLNLKKVCSVVLKLNYPAAYFSILDCPDGKIRMYYRGLGRSKETHMRESSDGIHFSKPKIILRESFVCHNFSPFLHDGMYYAIGGKCRFDGTRKKPNSKGLYLLHSIDGESWSLVREEPIITPDHPGYLRAPFGLREEFDSSVACVFHQGKHYLFFRANLQKGVRSIQYTVSENLIDWSEIRLVEFNPAFNPELGQNFYGPYFFNFEGKVMGMIPCFFNKKDSFIGWFEPDESLAVWHFKGWFNRAPVLPPVEKNRCFPVRGVIRNRQNPDLLNYYVHENYLKGLRDKPVTVDLYMQAEPEPSNARNPLAKKKFSIIRLRLLAEILNMISWINFHIFKKSPKKSAKNNNNPDLVQEDQGGIEPDER